MVKSALQLLVEQEVERVLGLLTEGIVHLDKLKPQALLDFLKAWNLDKSKFYVAEKMDGNYMALGVEDRQFYLRSKNRIFKSADEVPKIFFMNDFRKYFNLLQDLPWDQLFEEMSQKYGFEYNGTFEIEGEAIPSFDHNIVIYDEAKIGDGVFIIFNTKASVGKDKSGRVHNTEMWQEMADRLNASGPVKFFAVPTIDLGSLEFDNDLIIDLEELIKQHGNFLAKPARTPAAKELKTKLLAQIAEMGKTAKQTALKHQVSGKFGPEIEGVVVTGPDGSLVKIVDVEKFTARKETNWYFIDQLIRAEREFKKRLKNSGPEDLATFLNLWEESVKEVEQDFQENADEYITIKKKKEDTRDGIDFAYGMVKAMKDRLEAGDTPEAVVDDFNNRKIIPEATFTTSESVTFRKSMDRDLSEGGNVFEGMNSVVPRALLEPSIRNALAIAGFKGLPFDVVGNKTKKFFNDIDIAVNAEDLSKYLDLSDDADPNDLWEELENHLSRSRADKHSIIKGLKQFHILVPLVDSSGEHVNAFLPNGDRTDEPAMIQIDVFVGNLGWMADVNSGAPEDSEYKAVWRNKLLAAIASVVSWQEEGDTEDEYRRFIMDFRNGLKKRKVRVIPPSGRRKKPKHEKVADELVTSNPNELAEIFFGPGVKWSDINSYERLREMIESDKFRFKNYRNDVLAKIDSEMAKS